MHTFAGCSKKRRRRSPRNAKRSSTRSTPLQTSCRAMSPRTACTAPSCFYGNEDSDNPELEPVQGPGWRRRGANPVTMPVPFSHKANKAVLARYDIYVNHYETSRPRNIRG